MENSTRGVKPNKLIAGVDQEKAYLSPPADLPKDMKKTFRAVVRRMPAGFFSLAHVDALVQYVRAKHLMDQLYSEIQSPGFNPVEEGLHGSQVNPVVRAYQQQEAIVKRWMDACRLSPTSSYQSTKSVAMITPTKKKAGPADAKTRRLLNVV